MKTVNIHEAKTQLSKLAEAASRGEAFVIAKAGKPIVKVIALNAPTGAQVRRLGFMAGQISRLQLFHYVQASKFARLPDRPHRCGFSAGRPRLLRPS